MTPFWSNTHGDCREVMASWAGIGMQFDSVVTDPPYHLTSIIKRFGSTTAAPAKYGTDGAFSRASRGLWPLACWPQGCVALAPLALPE